MDPTIYDLLTKQKISEVTQSNLNNAAKETFVDASNVNFWSGAITIARILGESRTYAHGLPIPESSAVWGESIPALGNDELRPTDSVILEIEGISVQASGAGTTYEIYLTDASSNNVLIASGTVGTTGTVVSFDLPSPLKITNSLFLSVKNTHGSNAFIPQVAYHTVGL